LEPVCRVRCLEEDFDLVEGMLEDCSNDYYERLRENTTMD